MLTLKNIFTRTGFLLIVGLFLLTAATAATGTPEQTLLQGADAVNLEIKKHYTVKADGSYKLNLYVKRRVLTYKGKKEYADFKLSYNQARQQVKLIKAQTITGKGDLLTVKPEEIHDIPAPWNSEASLYSKSRQLVVSLPAVEPGSEIEVELELHSKKGFWCTENFRLNDPILHKTIIIDAPASLNLKSRTPPSLKLEQHQQKIGPDTIRYQWQGKNIPALTPERGAAPLLEQGFCLLISSFSNWQQVADLFKQSFINLQEPEKTAQPTIQHDNSAKDDSPISHQLYRNIRKLTTYEISFQETDWKVQLPAKTKRLGYGTDCDLALFFSTQLQRHQQPAGIVMVCSQNYFLEKFIDFPYPGWWDTALVKSGADFFLFTSEKAAPGITGYDGQVGLDLESGKIISIKDRAANRIERKLNLNFKNFPECQGKLTLNLYGASASTWRSQWRDLSDPEKEIAGNQFLHQIDPEAKFVKKLSINGLKDDRINLAFKCEFNLQNPCIKTTNNPDQAQYLLPINAPQLPFPLQSILENRIQPLTISDNLIIDDQVTIQLPDNYTFVTLPAVTSGTLPGFSWHIRCNVDPENSSLQYNRTITLQRGIIQTQTPGYRKFISVIRSLYQPEALRVILAAD